MSETLPRLLTFAEGGFDLVRPALPDCPVTFYMAIPKGPDEAEPARPRVAPAIGHAWLPPAARPGQGRAAAGRGLTDRRALASCLGEAAELVTACFWGDEPLASAPMAELGEGALHPNDLMLVSGRQYRTRETWNGRHGAYEWIPLPFDDTERIEWVEATSPDGGTRRFVPAAYAYIGYGDELGESRFCVGDSNGCAAAPSIAEATVGGFLELVERDAAAIWWYGQYRRPSVEPLSVSELGPLLTWHRARGRVLHLLDITTDLGIPTFAAISADQDGRSIAIGTSAHFSANRAAIAAVTEMVQVEVSIEMYEASDRPETAEDFRTWLSEVTFFSQPQLRPSDEQARPIDAYPTQEQTDPQTLLDLSQDICRRRGLTLLRIDLTRESVGVPVVRVVVPGLRPLRTRLAPGRLYEVPVALGWHSENIAEAQLNDTPLMI